MATPTSKATLKEYALRRLGKPVLEVNVSDDQVDDAIDYTIEKFQIYHYGGSEKVYLKHQMTQAEVDAFQADTTETVGTTDFKTQNNFLTLPDFITAVNGIFTFQDKGTANMFDIRYQLRLNDLFDFTSTQFYHYYMIQTHLETINFLLEGMKPTRFTHTSGRLYIDFDTNTDVREGEYIVIDCVRALDPVNFTKIYNEMWVKDYSTALIKKYWGTNLTKFQNVQLPGGVTLNGEKIYSDAVEELQQLEEQLRTTYEQPPMDMIG
tara:strand:- start:3613 stop:4407 length:795 start_codon:yes stop_codon:yes gene_type:complete